MFSVSQFAPPMKRAPSAPVPAAVPALLRRWRAQRPLRAGSLLVTIFGDAIAPRGAAGTPERGPEVARVRATESVALRASGVHSGGGPPVAGQPARCGRRTAARRQQRRSRRRPPAGELRLGPRGSRAALPALRRRFRTGRVCATRGSGASGRHGLRGPYAPDPRVPQDPPAGSAAAAGPAASRLGGKRRV